MAPQSSTPAWKIPWTEEPGGLQSMGSLRVGHDWATSLSLFTFMHWRRKWQPTPLFLPGESQGWGILVGCRLWGRTESDTTEVTQQQQRVIWAIRVFTLDGITVVNVMSKLPSENSLKEIKPVNPKRNQPWIFTGRTDAEAEAPVLWTPDAKSWLIGKDSDAGKDWREEEYDRGWDGWMASLTQWTWVWENSRRWWRTGKPACCCPWGWKELDTT